ncbi:HAAS signaling domain-containing protein [Staphylococcus intermedius]|uniref:Predicted membrane protein n=1 Tax=Staphylococcus intermedius NCTC 11048 TaxID=1141106 RepID=A0A380G452_STAIN|nr:DUF1700 domain-containing protein [Staphylococcus intermedius]PCF63791.1 hypothetical protein B5C04_07365 [Staphylococcus intermedius]PCF78506.1 hypothetical protein B4W74_07715 [Staphylococcus intermedius]PCF79479.1 hypothetical protein B4W70_07355 [Staphylococcus intermedius]PCF86784.1 hypothetical protein B4W76_06950 [Staphylococcus intermedius]PCF89863.1 hypothetical protein B4W75_03190 [Staphylococcus intermedius]
MTKTEYLNTLYQYLKGMSESEKQDIVAEYENHFIEGLRDGKTEQEIIGMLGAPKEMARAINAESAVNQAEERQKTSNITQALVTVIGLSVLNFVLITGPLMVVLGILLSIVLTGIAFLITPFALLFKYYALSEAILIEDVFAVIGWFGLGLILIVLFIVIIKWSYVLSVKYLKWNIKLVKRGVNK